MWTIPVDVLILWEPANVASIMSPMFLLFSGELLMFLFAHFGAGVGTTPSKQLAMDLLNNYGPRSVRPVKQPNRSMAVIFRAKPVWFSDFDERKQVLTFVSLSKYIVNCLRETPRWHRRQEWTDEFLTWDPTDYDGVERIELSKDDIWFPDITALERIGTGSDEVNIEETMVSVSYTGVAIYYHQSMLSAFCKMDVRLFPYDIHPCTISYTLYSLTTDKAGLFYSRDLDAQEDVIQKNGVWSIAKTEVEETEVKFLCCEEPFREVHVTMFVRRESGFYVLNLGLPTFLLSLTTLSVFLLHPECGEKISLCVNNVLALIIFQQLLALSMPPTGDNTPVVALYFVAMISISFLSVLTTCLTLSIYHNRGTRPFPSLLKRLLLMKAERSEEEDTSVLVDNVYGNDVTPNDKEDLPLGSGDRPGSRRGRRRSSGSAKRETNRRNVVGTTFGLVPIEIGGNGITNAPATEETFEVEWQEAAIRIDVFLFILSVSTMILTTIYCVISFLFTTKINNHE